MRLVINVHFTKRWVLILLAVLSIMGGAGGMWFAYKQSMAVAPKHALAISDNPIPMSIKDQLKYQTIYPVNSATIETSTISYQPQQQILSFNVVASNNDLVFTEQPAPSSLGSGNQIYYQAIGLHPYAQFETSLGPVALAKFFQTGSLEAAGESAFLDSHGTLLIAHSNTQLGNDSWKSLFDNLKLSQ